MTCQRRVEKGVSYLSGRVARLVDDLDEERERVARSKARTWRARAALAGRFSVVVVPLFASVLVFAWIVPEHFGSLISMLPAGLVERVLIGSLSTMLVLAFVAVVAGAKHENVRRALRPVVLDRLALRTTRRRLARDLKRSFDSWYDDLIGDFRHLPIPLDQAIAEGVVDSLENRSGVFRQAQQELDIWRRETVGRSELLDEFIDVVNEHLDQIPKELQHVTDEIRRDAIGKHMARIRHAASSVEKVKSDVQRIADIAAHAR